ncbi:hypothetical protein AVEN_122316-1 [Araneus ventricosus]|uniref:Uncharacterized protein n=1 Tax=Araneus ventricosus TaxID=182803 RepID=A0A4Y2VAC5_ARAVE|nr:hypothetical protein AVEN_58083-1 [Araneus ventricosus]GBO21523.1 hypothetical protein AVEN_122316-1 [Araneus ventricosus]
MRHVDALSRNAVCMATRSQSEITRARKEKENIRKIATAQEVDERLHLMKILVENELRDDYLIKCLENLTRRWQSVVGFVPVTTRWRSDALMLLLDVTEDEMSVRGERVYMDKQALA